MFELGTHHASGQCGLNFADFTEIIQTMANECPIKHDTPQAPAQCPVEHKELHPTCPVDHSSRAAWLKNVSVTVPEAIEVSANTTEGCDSLKVDQSIAEPSTASVQLPTDRQISSIPRTDTQANWVYPSQKQFYEAMQRKKWNPEAEDMKTVVPIHNVVNERTWNHILQWEAANVQSAKKKCGGITLTSFRGDSKKLTPRAWFKLYIMGQPAPFDRHDWCINRCGVSVDYVIDFYGSADGVALDVRPKLNSVEGIRLRLTKALGL